MQRGFRTGDSRIQNSIKTSKDFHDQIVNLCRHIVGSAQITGISLFDNCSTELPAGRSAAEVILVIRDFQPRIMSYVRMIDGRNVVIFAVDQWIFERDVERGFLGEASVGTLIFPYDAIKGEQYLHKQEISLKKRLILELLENLVTGFPELYDRLRIMPEFFMYEAMLNRVRVFPPLAYCVANFLQDAKEQNKSVRSGYLEALSQLEKEKKVIIVEHYVTIPKGFLSESRKAKIRFTNISKNAPRAFFTSIFEVFPQLLNFFAQTTEAILKLNRFSWRKDNNTGKHFTDPQRYIFVPTASGYVSLADQVSLGVVARKLLLNGEKGKIDIEPIGGVLNDVYVVKASFDGKEKRIVVKRFKDWSGFKWFPLSIWALGARSFAVQGRSRMERECAVSELLRNEGFNVPKVLHVSHSKRLVYMEYVEGENLGNSLKRIAESNETKKAGKELATLTCVGEMFARVHALNVALGDTKPENVIVNPAGQIFILDFEQASRGGDKAWDIAEFLYYSGHYLPLIQSVGNAQEIAEAFISGYLKAGGDSAVVRKAGAPKYTRVFSVFTMPSVILSMSNVCKKTRTPEAGIHG